MYAKSGNSENPTPKVTVALVEDHPLMREGVRAIIESDTTIKYLGGYSSLSELPHTARPHIIVLDLRLQDGSDPAQNVKQARSLGAEVLLYTSAEDPYSVRVACQAGACGVIRKSDPTDLLLQALHQIANGEEVAGLDWASALDSDQTFVTEELTEGERRILADYAMGFSSYQVARRLNISQHTVNSYVRNIRKKYTAAGREASSRVDLYLCAVEDSLIPGPFSTNK